MRIRLLAAPIVAGALIAAGLTPALAAGGHPSKVPSFGQHVASMAPEHAREHGAEFGSCVSAMARGLECPHHTH